MHIITDVMRHYIREGLNPSFSHPLTLGIISSSCAMFNLERLKDVAKKFGREMASRVGYNTGRYAETVNDLVYKKLRRVGGRSSFRWSRFDLF